MKMFIVTAVDISETVDGKARVLAVCNTREEAKAFVQNVIETWADEREGEDIEVDVNKMSAYHDYNDDACEWNIEEVDFEMPPINKSKVEAAEKVLVDNGIEEDEASTVLQAVGYALLDAELYS